MKKASSPSEWKRVMRGEQFSVYRNRKAACRYLINWHDHEGKRRRFKVWADSLEAAAQSARDLIAAHMPTSPEAADPLVIEAFELALASAKRGQKAQADWKWAQTRFIEWLAKHHVQAERWSMISRAMLREYVTQTLDGKAGNTRRLYLQPIVQTCGFMEREYEVRNIGLRLGNTSKLKKEPAMVPLTDVVDFLAWLEKVDSRICAGAALQGLAGLQLQEALRLNWGKVDLENGLIEISSTVKNSYRNRVIPVCKSVIDTLRRCRDAVFGQAVVPNDTDPVVSCPTGLSYANGKSSWSNYSKLVRGYFRLWNAELEWAPKDLRNCLPTFAVSQGILTDLWEQYLGHAPRTVTGRHYVPRLTSASKGEGAALKKQMDLFREAVLEPIEREMARKGHDTKVESVKQQGTS
jgi:integrase